jgi:hypothetical protein
LLSFLRILFWDGRIQEAALREQQARRHAEYHGPERAPRQAALAAALERVAGGKKRVVPRILKGVLDSKALQNLVTNHMAEVTAAKELYREHDTGDKPIGPNWSGCAEQFFFDQARLPWPDSPWEEVVGKLIGKCRVPGIDASFVCEWVARGASFAESDARTAELARLEGEGILGELLAELRNRFPQKAEEWFGAEDWQSANMPPATVPSPATTSEQNHATGSADDGTPPAKGRTDRATKPYKKPKDGDLDAQGRVWARDRWVRLPSYEQRDLFQQTLVNPGRDAEALRKDIACPSMPALHRRYNALRKTLVRAFKDSDVIPEVGIETTPQGGAVYCRWAPASQAVRAPKSSRKPGTQPARKASSASSRRV